MHRLTAAEHRHGQVRDRQGGGGYADAPPDAADVVVPADQSVDREAGWADGRDCDGDRSEGERELEPAVAVEEPVLPVDDEDRIQHHDRDPERCERRQEAGGEGDPARLPETREERHCKRPPPAERLEEAGGSAQPVTAEPAEELLRSVREHRSTHDHAQKQQSVGHEISLFRLRLTRTTLADSSIPPQPGL